MGFPGGTVVKNPPVVTEDEMVGWHHQLDEHEFEQTLGDGEEQGSLACRQGRKDSDIAAEQHDWD